MHDEVPPRGRYSRRAADDDPLLTHDGGLYTHGAEYRQPGGGGWARGAAGPSAGFSSAPRHSYEDRSARRDGRRDHGPQPYGDRGRGDRGYGDRGYGDRDGRGHAGQAGQPARPRPYPSPQPRPRPYPDAGRGAEQAPGAGRDPYGRGPSPGQSSWQPDARGPAEPGGDPRYPAGRYAAAPPGYGDPGYRPDRYGEGDDPWSAAGGYGAAGGLAVRPRPYLDEEDEDDWAADDVYPPDDGTGGRHRRAGGGGNRWVKYAKRAGAVVGVLALLAGGFVYYEYKHLDGNIKRVDVLHTDDKNIRNAEKQRNAENFLLIGSDTREGANSKYGAGETVGARSDTTILAHLSPDGDKAILVSFPRDSWVDLPSCKQPNGQMSAEQKGQFNAAFSIGGPACTILTVQKLTGIKVNHYVQVDFTGFKTMVHALGGIDVCSNLPIDEPKSGLRLKVGNNHVDGEQALAFVRARYGIGNGGDLGRIQRQQLFLGAMMRKATSGDILLKPVKLQRFLEAATKSVTMDKDTHLGDLKNLAQVLHGLDPARVAFVTPPIANPAYDPNNPSNPKGGRVLLDDVAGRALYDSIINDQVSQPKPTQTSAAPKPTTPAANAPTITVAPQQIRLRVFNGTSTNKLAAQVGTALGGYGFQVVETGNSPTQGMTQTEVRYGPGHVEEARTVAAAVPGAVLKEDATWAKSVALFLGANYSTTKPVQVGDTYRPSSGATTTKPSGPITPSNAIKASDTTCVS